MALEQLFQSVHILVEVIGFGLIIFKGGSYIGTITEILKNQNRELKDIKDDHARHVEEDKEDFRAVNKDVTDLKVALASEIWKKN